MKNGNSRGRSCGKELHDSALRIRYFRFHFAFLYVTFIFEKHIDPPTGGPNAESHNFFCRPDGTLILGLPSFLQI
jgi:hypothetical protein